MIPIAFISNSLPPYRVHLHQRVVRELPQLRVWSLRTHQEDARWEALPDAEASEIGLVSLDTGVSVWQQSEVRQWRREWRAGGRVVDWLARTGVRAVVLAGYNDPARLRVMLWCRLHRIPVLVWGDSNLYDEPIRLKNRPGKALRKRILVPILLRLASAVLCFGTAGRGFFTKYGFRNDRIFYFPLEPDYQAFADISASAMAEARERFGLRQDRRRLLFCGRLVDLKRVDLLLEGFTAIAARRPAWDLVILGDGELRQSLEQSVSPALRERVFWTGHVANQEVVRAVQRTCDVLVMTSEYEPWGLVVNEALAAGLAIVSAETVGAAVDLVKDGVNGRTFPRYDQTRLIECLLDVTDESRLSAMKAQSSVVLAEWKRIANPIDGLRKALDSVGIKLF